MAAVQNVQVYSLCGACTALFVANFDRSTNVTFCSAYFNSNDDNITTTTTNNNNNNNNNNFTDQNCAAAENSLSGCLENYDGYCKLVLLNTLYGVTFAPPMRVLCLGNVLNIVLALTLLFAGAEFSSGSLCSVTSVCAPFVAQLVGLSESVRRSALA